MHSRSAVTSILFTDIEGSTRLWAENRKQMAAALAAHDAVARAVVTSCHGLLVKSTGDGICAAFTDPSDALDAALAFQQALADLASADGACLQVRCGLHIGNVEHRDNDLFGAPVNRAARIMAAAYGGQILLSRALVDCIGEILPESVTLRDLGRVRLKDLATPEHVYQLVHPRLRQDFPALRSLEARPNNLPQQVTSFIGRERAMAEVGTLLRKSRLVTLLGAGGLGKSRLALHAGADALDDYPDGVWLVELAPLTDDRLVAQAVASVVGVKEEPGRPVQEALLKFVKDRQLLLILDNCEHLDAACGALAEELLLAGPNVKILATSREPLHTPGEATYPLHTLSFPDARSRLSISALARHDAVGLFIDRAVAAQPAFRLTDQNAVAVADICHRLDGIPLAIELAAARVRTMAVGQIDARLSDRFQLLTGGYRTALPRLQTLRACIDWSYELLSVAERRLLQRLAIFAGGWSLEAAEAVGMEGEVDAAETLDFLAQLVDKSLVEFGAEGRRYRLLETVRQYAGEKLVGSGNDQEARERHRNYFLRLAEEAEPNLTGAQQAEWLRRLEQEHENLRVALGWGAAASGDPAGGLRLASALWWFWYVRGFFDEGRGWLTTLLGVAPGMQAEAVRAKALNAAGGLAYGQGDNPAAQVSYEATLVIQRKLGDRQGIAGALGNLGNVAMHQGDYPSARALLEEGLAIRRELGDRAGVATSLMNLGAVAFQQGDFPAAQTMLEECLAMQRQLENRYGIAMTINNLGGVAFEQRDYPLAHALFDESLVLRRELGDRHGIAMSLANLGEVAFCLGDYVPAKRLYEESLAIRLELGDRGGIAESLEGIAYVAVACAEFRRAARVWGAAERLREENRAPLPHHETARHDHQVALARAGMNDDAVFEQAWQEGRAATIEQAMDLELESNSKRGA